MEGVNKDQPTSERERELMVKYGQDEFPFAIYQMNDDNPKGSGGEEKIDFGINRTDRKMKYFIAPESWNRNSYKKYLSEYETTIIRCKNDKKTGKVSGPHCQIAPPSFAEDILWITDLMSKHGTFVNGTRIPANEKFQLVNGDIIGLGGPASCGNDGVHVFKVKGLKSKVSEGHVMDEDDSSPICQEVFSNPSIFDNILSHLGFGHLKTARLVNKYWKSRTEPVLFPRTIIKLDDYSDTVGWKCALTDKIALIRKYNLGNWWADETKDSDIKRLLKESGHLVRYLRFRMTIGGTQGLGQILSSLHYIEFLDVTLEIENPRDFLQYWKRSHFLFPTVRTLSPYIYTSDRKEVFESYQNSIWLEVLKSFPNVEKAYLNQDILQPLLQCVNSHGLWKGLKEVDANIGFTKYEGDQCRIQRFEQISNLSQNLTRLRLGYMMDLKQFEFDALGKTLKRHSSTLESLVLHIPSTEGDQKPVLRMPAFPKLKNLEYVFTGNNDRIPIETIFPSGSVCYERDLPEIKKLKLRGSAPGCWNWPVLEVFLPKDSETICATMRIVEYGVVLKGEIFQKNAAWFRDTLSRFPRVFPNVFHRQIMEGLEILKSEAQQ